MVSAVASNNRCRRSSICLVTQAAVKIEIYNAFAARAEELDLPSAVEAQPILNVRTHLSSAVT